MEIIGGVYRELCMVPAWNQIYGSGGRAARAICGMSSDIRLHTYENSDNAGALEQLKALGIKVSATPSDVAVAFSYFHPLSRPYIEPRVEDIPRQKDLIVSGDVVLWFGLLEGNAMVDASRIIYDPQSSVRSRPPILANAKSKELAIVLNELELSSMTGIADMRAAVARLLSDHGADVVTVKAGVKGAFVFERNSVGYVHVPAYFSSKVFKIGTGDVFSAAFSFFWGEEGLSPSVAADKASRAVANYCSSMSLPIDPVILKSLRPVKMRIPSTVFLVGNAVALGSRYVMEEAKFRLNELGVEVISPDLDGRDGLDDAKRCGSVLVISDGMINRLDKALSALSDVSAPIVIYADADSCALSAISLPEKAKIETDFSTALYLVAWDKK